MYDYRVLIPNQHKMAIMHGFLSISTPCPQPHTYLDSYKQGHRMCAVSVWVQSVGVCGFVCAHGFGFVSARRVIVCARKFGE